MSNTIEKGITIRFKGDTADFDKGVSQVNGQLKTLKSELSLLNRELKLDPTNLEKLSQKMDVLKEREDLLKTKLDAYKEAMKTMDAGSDEFKKAEKEARNLEIEISYVSKAIEEMGGNKVSLALNTLSTKLEGVGSKFTSLGKKMAGVSAAAGSVLGAFGKMSVDVVRSADDINTLAKQTGLSTDTIQAFGQMADLIDVDLNTLSKSAVNLTKNIDTTKATEAYDKLGISVKNLDGNYKDSETLLFETIKALQQVEDETERSLLANDLFGKSYVDLGSILNDASVDLDDINKTVKENGVILSSDDLNALNSVNDNLDTLKMTLSSVGTSLVSEFQEPLGKVTDKLVELGGKVKTFVNNISTEDKEKILKVLAVVATVAPALILIGTVISKVASAISVVSGIITTIIPIIKALFVLLSTNPLAQIALLIAGVVAVVGFLIANFDTIKEKIADVWDKFKETKFVQDLIDIFEKLKGVLDNVIESLKSVFDWIGNTISKVGDFFASGVEKVVGWFSSGGFGNVGAYASGGYGSLELNTTINVNNNGQGLTTAQAQSFGREIVDYVNEKLGRRI